MSDRYFWQPIELEALERCLQATSGRYSTHIFCQILSNRSSEGIRAKIRRLREENPEKWVTPPVVYNNPPVNLALLKKLEADKCNEKSQQSETHTVDLITV